DDWQLQQETALDLSITHTLVPKARLALYFGDGTERSWVELLDAAIHDTVNQPDVLSISWGYSERNDLWTQSAIGCIQEILAKAAMLGITVCCASGDQGANFDSDGARVEFPASSDYVLACGGTSFSRNDEIVWDGQEKASGGGISDTIPKPVWQKNIFA